MHKALLFTLVFAGAGAACAQATQPVEPQQDSHEQMTSEQKRTELRKVLSGGRAMPPASRTEQGAPAAQLEPDRPALRQLSQKEHAEMREQLRRYRPPLPVRAHSP